MSKQGDGTVPDAALDATQLDRVRVDAPLQRGATVGRYMVADVVGTGGMGVVYAAYDPELDRKVALKLLRGVDGEGSQGRTRLLREAQAMARLADPNVIQVFDVGTIDDQVFVAMELVDGVTLRAWSGGRSRDEVLAMYVQAARGLQAAHSAGLIHRDFKPDNVLVGVDGRARVLDFGLARVSHEPPTDEARVAANPTALTTPLTRTGAFLGTPAYMAPEQLNGDPVDATCDQFAFCVALYEALYGERPFAGGTVDELLQQIRAGRVREPDAARGVSSSLRRALIRGLAADPRERYESVAALLEAIDPAPAPRRTGPILAAASALVLLVVAGGFALRARLQPCRGAQAKLVGVWDDARRDGLRAAFVATGSPLAESAFSLVSAALDRYARAWISMHVDCCEATRVRGEQSEELLDLRMSCLADRRSELGALAALFAHADRELVARAPEAAASLTGLEGCANTAALRAPVRAPNDAKLRAQVDAIRAEEARARALRAAARYPEGIAVETPLVASARQLRYRPVEAETLVLLGQLQLQAGDLKAAESALSDGTLAAEAARDAHLQAEGFASLVSVLTKGGRFDEARTWSRHGFAALEGAGDDPRLRAQLIVRTGMIAYQEGKYDEAIAQHKEALAILEKIVPPDDLSLSEPLNSLGHAYSDKGDLAAAAEVLQRDLRITEKALGPQHPEVARALVALGNAVDNQGQHQRAFDYYERALEINEKVLGPEHFDVGNGLFNAAVALGSMNEYVRAESYLRRSLVIYQKSLGPDHQDVATILTALADNLRCQKKLSEALSVEKQALAIQEKRLPADHPDVATTLSVLGGILFDLGDSRAAVSPLERGLAIFEKSGGAAISLGETRFALAMALAGSGGDRLRMRKLAQAARADFVSAGEAKRKAAVDAWLEKHRLN